MSSPQPSDDNSDLPHFILVEAAIAQYSESLTKLIGSLQQFSRESLREKIHVSTKLWEFEKRLHLILEVFLWSTKWCVDVLARVSDSVFPGKLVEVQNIINTMLREVQRTFRLLNKSEYTAAERFDGIPRISRSRDQNSDSTTIAQAFVESHRLVGNACKELTTTIKSMS